MGSDRYDKNDEEFVKGLKKVDEILDDEYCLHYKDEVCAILLKYGRDTDNVIAKHIRDLTLENYRLMTTVQDARGHIWYHFQKAEYIK